MLNDVGLIPIGLGLEASFAWTFLMLTLMSGVRYVEDHRGKLCYLFILSFSALSFAILVVDIFLKLGPYFYGVLKGVA